MLDKIAAFFTFVMGFIRWTYFLRFSLALWLFPLLLVGFNKLDQTLTSGILVPEFPQGYLCVAFFLVSSGFAALISARVTLINGPERWNECAEVPEKRQPTPLDWLLVNDKSEWETLAVVVSLIPALLTGFNLFTYGRSQGVTATDIISGLVVGMLAAGVIWYVANVWYYFTYNSPDEAEPKAPAADSTAKPAPNVALGVNAARTILYPRWMLSLSKPGTDPSSNKIENAETFLTSPKVDRIADWLSAKFITLTGQRGYGYKNCNKLYEAQIFAIIAMFVFIGLYLMIWPMAAPVPSLYMSVASIGILFVCVVLATVVFWSAKPKPGLLKWKICLTILVFAFWILVCWTYISSSAERFPIFATVLILAISFFWTLAGIAFFVDRYRVPVLTLLLLAMLLPRLPHLSVVGSHEEHYFSTVSGDSTTPGSVLTPAEILDGKLKDPATDRPLIIVTATGGGLHASAWTTAVLARLEREFANDPAGKEFEPFHQHVLLMSTVSGGSVGLSAFLKELHEGNLDQTLQQGVDQPGLDEMQKAAQCSSLEAVGWGLVYYDLPKALVPLTPYFFPSSTGVDDLDKYETPLFKDRTWALRKGIERNENNSYCDKTWKSDLDNDQKLNASRPLESHLTSGVGRLLNNTLAENLKAEKANRETKTPLTLRAFLNAGQGGFPAFAMNTTSVERGNRFLLANYRVPHYSLGTPDVYPAQSFLDTFADCSSQISDLPLATAAQLSATFPYVSSAARAPESVNCQSVHFVDGGYYDNDGTGSAIEFLRYALAPSGGQGVDEQEKIHLASIKTKLDTSPLRILWIEIRNSGDDDGGKENTKGGNGASADPDNILGQVGAVPQGFWNAGHESITGRTRVALGLMQKSTPCQLQIHRIVLADTNSKEATKTDPLNWSLTPRQRSEVRKSAGDMKKSYEEAKKWFYGDKTVHNWSDPKMVDDWPCISADKTRPTKR